MVRDAAVPFSSHCAAVAGDGNAGKSDMLLGSDSSGSIQYVEPRTVVAINNEASGAQAELSSAEKEVLQALTQQVLMS